MTISELRQLFERRNQRVVDQVVVDGNEDGFPRLTPEEHAAVLQFRGDLAHDLALVDELLEKPKYVGLPRLLREPQSATAPARAGTNL